MIMNTGMMIVCSGTIIVARKAPKITFLPGKRDHRERVAGERAGDGLADDDRAR